MDMVIVISDKSDDFDEFAARVGEECAFDEVLVRINGVVEDMGLKAIAAVAGYPKALRDDRIWEIALT